MKVCVFGLWHLGSITAACLAAAGFETVGLDSDAERISALARGEPPLFEPGLEDLVNSGLAGGALSFSSELATVRDADVVWVAFDTPVDEDDRADVDFVVGQIRSLFPYLRDGAVVLVSSQMPVGTMREIERQFSAAAVGRKVVFAYSPENLRLGRAIEVFRNPERVVVGLSDTAGRDLLETLFAPFSENIIWVGMEAAEISKHAVNAFLATSITFINEIAMICEKYDADVREVERALRSEPRIGAKAYIRPGGAFAGGTLARDVNFLAEIAHRYGLPLDMIGSILASNRFHSSWPLRRLREELGELAGRNVTVLGLTYKPGTDTLRRSLAVALCRDLAAAGTRVTAFDPVVSALPEPPVGVSVAVDLDTALKDADAAVVMTEWPEFSALTAERLIANMRVPIILDQNGFLDHLAGDARIRHIAVGRATRGRS
jgi:UDPglucose 6-dehydrogenase